MGFSLIPCKVKSLGLRPKLYLDPPKTYLIKDFYREIITKGALRIRR